MAVPSTRREHPPPVPPSAGGLASGRGGGGRGAGTEGQGGVEVHAANPGLPGFWRATLHVAFLNYATVALAENTNGINLPPGMARGNGRVSCAGRENATASGVIACGARVFGPCPRDSATKDCFFVSYK